MSSDATPSSRIIANMSAYNVAVPVKLDAFVLNKDSCAETRPAINTTSAGSDKESKDIVKIAPITQPNYAFLRIKDFVLQNDVLDHVDVHAASPESLNSRVTDLGTGGRRENRMGVYLHWIVPRPYRSGKAPSKESNSDPAKGNNANVPTFRSPPTRWVVIRCLDPNAKTTQPINPNIPPVQAWVVESDKMWSIDDETLDDEYDLQVDVSPYIGATDDAAKAPEKVNPEAQAEVFIGKKSDAKGWTESGKNDKRVNLNLLNSSNQLFPDYQPHNGNVFSIIDRFEYTSAGGDAMKLTDAVAHYYVLGWHWDDTDPFADTTQTNEAILASLSMELKKDSGKLSEWLKSPAGSKVVCHGAMYNVEWHDGYQDASKLPEKRPGDKFVEEIRAKMSVSLGSTPIDSMLTWIETHHEGLAHDIYLVRQLLRAHEENVAGLQAAADELQMYNFARFAGGTHFNLPSNEKRSVKVPDSETQGLLRDLNRAQAMFDAGLRMYKQKQWDTFSTWWKAVTDVDETDHSDAVSKLREARQSLNDLTNTDTGPLWKQLKGLQDQLTKQGLQPKSATLPTFSQKGDPSLFVPGAKSGWQYDYLDKLCVRADPQIYGYPSSPNDGGSTIDDATYGIACLPSTAQATGRCLVQEFLKNIPGSVVVQSTVVNPDTVDPLYHDQGNVSKPTSEDPWRDRWESTQPWFPLFLEWEVEYFHIDWESWKFQESTTWKNNSERYMYSLPVTGSKDALWTTKPDPDLWDRRTLSGRILLLPQPTFSLKAELEKLFSSTPKDIIDPILPQPERETLLKQITNLPFLSAPLDGFSSHLATLCQGSHLKPNVRVGDVLRPMKETYNAAQATGTLSGQPNLTSFHKEDIEGIGIESGLTPYGSLVQLPSIIQESENSQATPLAFKPVAHGQFRFTKINIVDKFGQCAPIIDQTPRVEGPPNLYPMISDYYKPQAVPDSAPSGDDDDQDLLPNVALEPKTSDCQFVQVQPAINQPTRLNFDFLTQDSLDTTNKAESYWRPVADWENPIWGWLIVNYVDNGVQFFLPSGRFYREVRVSSPDAPPHDNMSPKWLPFPDTSGSVKGNAKEDTRQLDALLKLLNDKDHGNDYLEAFIKMITNATENTHHAPSAYGQFTSALVGRPLAMVNVGVSLELSGPPLTNQSTIQKADERPHQSVEDYDFSFKLGDKDALYDGLVGYFKAMSSFEDLCNNPGTELQVNKIYTDHVDGQNLSDSPLLPTDQDAKTLKPIFVDPMDIHDLYPKDAGKMVLNYTQQRQGAYNKNVFGVIIDPFTPLHAYSGILPIASLQLNPWTWESAFQQMTTFFHAGPLVVTGDVPSFNSKKALSGDYDVKKDDSFGALNAVALPAGLKSSEWAWLQPYVDEEGAVDKFMALGLKATAAGGDNVPQFEKGPYTALEGFLQMRTPIQQPPS